jgi:hypothetical protein
MKSSSTALLVTGLCVIAIIFAVASMNHAGNNSGDARNAGNAAFRDGAYQGRLAAQRGDRPHLTAARWSPNVDRRAYVAGYQQAYLRALGQNGITVPHGIEETGYRHGLEDGAQDRQNTQLFRSLGRLQDHGNLSVDETYRDAYSAGYQFAYYGEQEVHNALVIRPVSLGSY